MTFIGKEVPTWVINGVNTVYTLLNTPDYIDDLWMDGAIYTDYVLVWNVVTLVDPPTVSIFLDYYTGPTETPVVSSVTLGDIKATAWGLLGQTSKSTTFSDSVLNYKINHIISELCKGRYVSLASGINWVSQWKTYRCGKIWFIEWNMAVRKVASSALTVDYSIWDTTLTCETTNLLAAGYVEIGGEIFTYTSKSATQLLWVSWGTIEHLETESVVQLYDTPSDFSKPSTVDLIITGTDIKTVPIPLREADSSYLYYQIFRLGAKQLFKIIWVEADDLVKIKYTKVVTNMTADTDLCILPENYGITVVAYIVAGELGMEHGMPNSLTHNSMGCAKLGVMFGDFGNTETITKQSLRPTSYSNIWGR